MSLSLSVGAGRFELPTSRTRTERATKLRYAPEGGGGQWSEGFDLSRMRRRVWAIFVQRSSLSEDPSDLAGAASDIRVMGRGRGAGSASI